MFGLQKHIDRKKQRELEEQENNNSWFNNSNSGFDIKRTAVKATVAGVVGYKLGKNIAKW